MLDDVKVGEDLEEFYLVPVEEANYVRVKTNVTDDLTNITEDLIAITSDEEDADISNDPLADFNVIIKGVATINDNEGEIVSYQVC